MKLSETQIEETKKLFHEMVTLDDFVGLLNYVDQLLRNEQNQKRPIKVQTIPYYAFIKEDKYTTFQIPKKSGALRTIHAPESYLKRIQSALSVVLLLIHRPTYASHGFLIGKNIISNAKAHVNKRYVYNLDLLDFFPSVHFRRVKTVLELDPFDLSESREPLAFLIANLACEDGVLPQGAPTSPILTNIVCQQLDRRLTKYATKIGCKYTRYVDDITFSSNKKIFNSKFEKEVEKIILAQNFAINKKKVRLSNSHQRQEVTGLIVNEKVNVNRNYIRTIRAMLNNWEKRGKDYAHQEHTKHYSKNHLYRITPDISNVLRGRIDFLGLVRGIDDKLYTTTKLKFEVLNNQIDYLFVNEDWVRERLDRDNIEMERIYVYRLGPEDDNFIAYCLKAFLQIENLINYYYYKRYQNIDEFKRFLIQVNPIFRARPKLLNRHKNFKSIPMSNKIWVFESEFYYGKVKNYVSNISTLRVIRNHGSHRCSIMLRDEIDIQEKYNLLQSTISLNETYLRTERDNDISGEAELIPFLIQGNYKLVRETVKDIADKVRRSLGQIARAQAS